MEGRNGKFLDLMGPNRARVDETAALSNARNQRLLFRSLRCGVNQLSMGFSFTHVSYRE
jgi:hypothetical protein